MITGQLTAKLHGYYLDNFSRLSLILRFCSRFICAYPGMLGILILAGAIQTANAAPLVLDTDASISLAGQQHLYIAKTDKPPQAAGEIDSWIRNQESVEKINLFGGAYWLYAEVVNHSDITDWVVYPNGTLIANVTIYVYDDSNSPPLVIQTGYRSEHDYMLQYGKDLTIEHNAQKKLLIHFESIYFASPPKFEIAQKTAYQKEILYTNVLILAAFGALLTLSLYNLFIFLTIKDPTYFY